MPTVYSNLHIVASDDPEGHLRNWLLNRIDRSFRLRFALEAQVVQRLAQLDRIGVIELRPLNRYRLRLSKAFRWRPHGPVMEYFRDHAMVDYFSGGFGGPGESLSLVHGSISKGVASTFLDQDAERRAGFCAAAPGGSEAAEEGPTRVYAVAGHAELGVRGVRGVSPVASLVDLN